MIGSTRGARGTERQLHRSAVNVGNKVTSGIALNDATNISDVMSKTRQNKIGVVARGRRTLQMTPDQDVMADKRDQHRVFDVVIQRIAVADAFQRKLCREWQQFGELGMGRAKPAARFRSQERTQRLRHHLRDRNQRQWQPDLALAPRIDSAICVYDLRTSWCHRICAGRCSGSGPAIDDCTTRRSTGHAGIAHWRQRAPDACFGGRYEPVVQGGLATPDQTGCKYGHGSQRQNDHLLGWIFHFLVPGAVAGGTSSNSIMANAFRSAFFASAGGLNTNVSASTGTSVFQSLIFSEYCGAPASVLLVITYFRGIGRAPFSIHIC